MVKAFVINLDRRKDRWESFQQRFDGVDDLELCRVSAVDHLTLKITRELKPRINEWNFKYAPDSVKKLAGCCMSHLNIWKIISKLKEPALVFEDDCSFINDQTKQQFNNFLNTNSGNGIIWLNGANEIKPGMVLPELDFNLIQQPRKPHGNTTESYLISPSFANELYNSIVNNIGAVDVHMWQYINLHPTKAFQPKTPFFCQVDRSDSDIQK